jgi:L-asparaginase/Glu-tRNA(Gln) amidotransferase subunit D
LEWQELEKLTQAVKKETRFPNFDVAMGSILKRDESREIIRIYSPEMNEEVLVEISEIIRKQYADL